MPLAIQFSMLPLTEMVYRVDPWLTTWPIPTSQGIFSLLARPRAINTYVNHVLGMAGDFTVDPA
jgi:hypothetical protein